MKIIYLLPTISRAGGVKVILEHLHGLQARGRDAQMASQ